LSAVNKASEKAGRKFPWIRTLIGLLAGALGLLFITRDLEPEAIKQALIEAKTGYIFLAVLVIFTTILAKTWRWQLLFINNGRSNKTAEIPTTNPRMSSLFWPLILGQFINAISPVRVGDLARVVALEQESGIDKIQAIGTLVVEKTLDIIVLVLTLFLILPTVVLPESVTERGTFLASTAAAIFVMLLFFAYQREWVIGLTKRIIKRLPNRLQQPLTHLIVAGLAGLSALRQPRQLLSLTFVSAVIMALSILTPFILFSTFDLEMGLKEAALLHLTLIIGLIPASTPANVGIFEGLVAFTMNQLGQTNNAAIISYAIIYHLVVVLPQIFLGSISVIRSNWQSGRKQSGTA
jgi:uncharacterized protein (TIRG00374 family)